MRARSFLAARIAPLAFGGVAMALVVAACGGGEEPTPAPTPTPQIIERTVVVQPTPGPTPTAAPTPTPRIVERTVVVQPTATPVPNTGAITERINGFRWIQNPPNWLVPPKRGGTHTYAFTQRVAALDPVLSRSFTTNTHATIVYNQLVRCQMAPNQKVGDIGICEAAPDLADSWSVGGDGKTWTFKLNQKARWHNVPAGAFGYDEKLKPLYGRDFVAADVVHAIDMWLGKLTKPDGSPQGRPGGGEWGNIASARAVDDDTVQFTIKEPDPFFPLILADFQSRIVPPEVFKLDGDYEKRMVGTGSMILQSRDPQVRSEFIANPNFWRNGADGKPLPYIDKHVIAIITDTSRARGALIAGQVDSAHDIGATTPTAALNFGRDCPSCQIAEMFSVVGIFSMGFRTEGDGAPFTDIRARLAIAKAIDWQSLIKNVHDEAAILPPTTNIVSLIFDDTPTVARNIQTLRDAGVKDEDNLFIFDPARARQLWAASGHKEGERHSIVYNEYTTQPVTKQFIAIASELKKNLNIEVEVGKVSDINIYYTAIGYLGGQKHQNFPSMALYITTVSPTNAGAILFLKPGRQLNLAEINNPKILALADEMAKGVPLEREKAISREVWLIEQRDEIKRLTLPSGARYIAYGPRLRNAYQQSRGGEAFHQGGHLVEVIWLDR